MKIAIFGANGMVGKRILDEAVSRKHDVTVIARNPSKYDGAENFSVVAGDATDSASVAQAAAGSDVVISAVGPNNASPETVIKAAQALLEGTEKAGVRRLFFVGGAGSLTVGGVRLIDTPNFPEAWRPIAEAHVNALEVFKNSTADVDWVSVSPPALIEPGERTGKYRVGEDELLTDDNGESRISVEDYAAALLDEAENAKFKRQRITFAY